MASVTKLSDQINNTPYTLDKYWVKKWNSIKPILKYKYVAAVNEVTPLYAEKYKHDLYGLFKIYFGISDQYVYPHIIVNDFDSSYDYNGNKLRFRMLDNSKLNYYISLFKKNRYR